MLRVASVATIWPTVDSGLLIGGIFLIASED